MMAINLSNSKRSGTRDPLIHYCQNQNCHRKLKVSQIQQKRLSRIRTFNIFIFYCRKCDVYYIIFKFINFEKKSRRKRYDGI